MTEISTTRAKACVQHLSEDLHARDQSCCMSARRDLDLYFAQVDKLMVGPVDDGHTARHIDTLRGLLAHGVVAGQINGQAIVEMLRAAERIFLDTSYQALAASNYRLKRMLAEWDKKAQ